MTAFSSCSLITASSETQSKGSMSEISIHHGDCLAVMAELEEASVDAVVTDPPYELAFMGRTWDASGIAFNADTWALCLRALKPGGHLLAFGGTRTWHRLTCAIEDAGFEIRDSVAWLYGSGFPKSLDVSKAIDKAAGADAAKQWQGWGTALKPAFEPIVLARKPIQGTVAANVLAHGTGALNIDGCRVETDWKTDPTRRGWQGRNLASTNSTVTFVDHNKELSQPHAAGRWPPNVVLDETQAAELDKQSGITKDGVAVQRNRSGSKPGSVYGPYQNTTDDQGYGGGGGASRFFPVFKYQAKAPAKERPKVNDISHPTVKPLALMRWLVKLVTPPGGIVLDPFAGSGTTGEACLLEGFQAVLIESEADYIPLIRKRCRLDDEEAA
jgi:site-specific DNA-methyltransferase (adenine-specific)